MEQTTTFEPNTVLLQLQYAIRELRHFDGIDDEDDVIYTTNRLNAVLRMIHDNHRTWHQDVVRDVVLRKHDPLKNISAKSHAFSDRVRKIQQDMISQFTWH